MSRSVGVALIQAGTTWGRILVNQHPPRPGESTALSQQWPTGKTITRYADPSDSVAWRVAIFKDSLRIVSKAVANGQTPRATKQGGKA
jgi:hypothetical protein